MKYCLAFLFLVVGYIFGTACIAEDRLVARTSLILKHPPINKSIGNPVHCLAFLKEDSWLATGATSGIHVWDARTGDLLHTLEADERSVDALAQDAQGKRLISGGASGVIRVWDARTLKPMAKLGQTSGAVRSLAISANGRLLATASPNSPPSPGNEPFGILFWDLTTNELVQRIELPPPTFGSTALAFLDDNHIVAAQDRCFRLIDVQKGSVVKVVEMHSLPRTIGCLAINSEGQLVTGVFEARLRLWNTNDWKQLLAWDAHHKQPSPRCGVSAVSFSPDGTHVLSGGLDGTVCVWEATTGRQLLELDGRGASTNGWVTGVAMASNNRLLSATHFGGSATIWRLEIEK